MIVFWRSELLDKDDASSKNSNLQSQHTDGTNNPTYAHTTSRQKHHTQNQSQNTDNNHINTINLSNTLMNAHTLRRPQQTKPSSGGSASTGGEGLRGPQPPGRRAHPPLAEYVWRRRRAQSAIGARGARPLARPPPSNRHRHVLLRECPPRGSAPRGG